MIGSDSAYIPSRNQTLTNGKKTSDMIADNVRVSKSGDVTGDINYLSGMSSYPDGQQSGHYFPTQINSKLYGTKLHVGGKTNETGFTAGKDFTPTVADPYLVIRVENCTDDNKVTVYNEATKGELFTLNFGTATLGSPVGEYAVKPFGSKTDFGRYGQTELFWDAPPEVTWDGINGKVTGTLKYYKSGAEMLKTEGHWLPVVLDQWFKTQQRNVAVFVDTEKVNKGETDWLVHLDSKEKPITVKDGETVVAKLDLTGLTLAPDAVAYAAASTKRAAKKTQ